MKMTRLRRAGVVSLACTVALVAGTFGAAGAANADPTGAPTFRSLAGVGSDTTQDLYNGLSQRVLNAAGTTKIIGSYNATGSATIKTKTAGTTFNRPSDSGYGVAALKAAKTSTAFPAVGGVTLSPTDLQFARSSSGAVFVPGGAYSYIPIALDAVTFAKGASAAAPNNIPLGTSTGQDTDADGILDLTLRNIYTRSATTILEDASGTTFTVGNQASGAQIVPFKPQSGSDTLSYWRPSGTLAVWTAALGGTFGAIVADTYVDGGTSHNLQENDGAVTGAVPNAIVPFSVGSWIGQSNSATLSINYGVTVLDRRIGAQLGAVNNVPSVVSGSLNPAAPIAAPLFTVVKFTDLASNANLASVFSGATAKAYTATRTPVGPLVINDFGFGSLAGGVTINGTTYTAGDTTSFRAN